MSGHWWYGRHSVVNTRAIEDIVFKTSGDTVNVREPATKIYSAKLIAQGDFNAHSHTLSFVSFRRTCNLSKKLYAWLPDHAT